MLVHFPLHFSARRVSYICLMLSKTMNHPDLQVDVVVPSRSGDGLTPIALPAIGDLWGRCLFRFNKPWTSKLVERKTLAMASDYDCVYIWSDVSTAFVQALKQRGVFLVREKFNGMRSYAANVLDHAYQRFNARYGTGYTHTLLPQQIEMELEQLHLVDRIFCANPLQLPGYYNHGLTQQVVMLSSYGWDPARIPPVGQKSNQRFTLLYVGEINVRKGADLLLESWDKFRARTNDTQARLILIGPIHDQMRNVVAQYHGRPDVQIAKWTDNIGEVYAQADAFAFPTHSEGGPLVTYEAMGRGLPVLVSPMGAGAIARDKLDGFVLDPQDTDAWADGIAQLHCNPDLRTEIAQRAQIRAAEFTWDKVGARRRQNVLDALAG